MLGLNGHAAKEHTEEMAVTSRKGHFSLFGDIFIFARVHDVLSNHSPDMINKDEQPHADDTYR